MTLEEARKAIEEIEDRLHEESIVEAHTFVRDGRELTVSLTERARKAAKKARIWKSKEYLTAFKNAGYGFDEQRAFSGGGADGIFILTREHKPPNSMMKSMFDRFIDKPDDLAIEIADRLDLDLEELVAVRLVSHHLRLLGILCRREGGDQLIIVDHDAAK